MVIRKITADCGGGRPYTKCKKEMDTKTNALPVFREVSGEEKVLDGLRRKIEKRIKNS